MPLNQEDAARRSGTKGPSPAVRGKWLVGNVIKFPDEGRIVRFGRTDAQDESATVIILPVVRIERFLDPTLESAEPQTRPPADSGGRRRVRRR